MLDIPPDVSVALDVVKTLNASGRCREDGDLYGVAAGLVRSYLTAAAGALPPPPAPSTPAAPAVAGVVPRAA